MQAYQHYEYDEHGSAMCIITVYNPHNPVLDAQIQATAKLHTKHLSNVCKYKINI